jgi:hypothetical protein
VAMKFTITIHNKSVIEKLESKKNSKGEYVSKLIEKDIEVEELKKRIEALEGKKHE